MPTFHVYILASHSRTLYVGVTRDLIRRLYQHRTGELPGFSRRYRTHKLVYFEATTEARAAFAREKLIMGWTRAKKFALIESVNAGWEYLARDWFPSLGD
jgi:putative endonuclease